jgi:pimeloyl-ACP methyl ester carboxylesterase
MHKLIVLSYQAYFLVISRLLPRYAAERALNLLFTVNAKVKTGSRLRVPDETIKLKSGAHLFKWEGKRKESLMFVHGWNGSLDQFETAFNYFNALEYTVYGLTPAGHGLSTLAHSHPGLFIDAIKEAAVCLPDRIDLAVGHSMGGGALALAASEISIAKQLVLIASPASFLDVVQRFAGAIKLGKHSMHHFIDLVERFVGRSHASLEVMEKVRNLAIPTVVMHDELDREVPFNDALKLHHSIPDAELMSTRGLGHNRILRDDEVLRKIVLRMCNDGCFSEAVVG